MQLTRLLAASLGAVRQLGCRASTFGHVRQQLAFTAQQCMLLPALSAGPKDYEYGKVYQLEWKCERAGRHAQDAPVMGCGLQVLAPRLLPARLSGIRQQGHAGPRAADPPALPPFLPRLSRPL